MLQLIESLFFKTSNVKINKIFNIEIKNHVREILFRIYNLFIDFINFIKFCGKIDQNYYHYQRDRSKFSNFYSVFYKAMFFFSFRFRFALSKILQNDFNNTKTTKFVLNVIHHMIDRMFVLFLFILIFLIS